MNHPPSKSVPDAEWDSIQNRLAARRVDLLTNTAREQEVTIANLKAQNANLKMWTAVLTLTSLALAVIVVDAIRHLMTYH